MATGTSRVRLTAGRVESFTCPPEKSQSFLWDTEAPALMLRATPSGRKTYAFEARLSGETIRIGIGTAADWSLDQARRRAAELKQMVDAGTDPREVERAKVEEKRAQVAAALKEAQAAQFAATKVADVWSRYLEERRPYWGERHHADHLKLARAGGMPAKRGTDGRGVTIDMPLFPLMGLELRQLDSATVEAWAAEQAKTRPTSARLAWRLLKVFLNWCAEQPDLQNLLPAKNAAATRKSREALGRAKAKTDALLREQLPAWFAAVQKIQNPTISAYLQVMLLTGGRPGEILTMSWQDINTQWRGVTLRDKVEGERVIPLTPYVAHLLARLPRRNEWVFASTRAVNMDEKNIKRRERRALEKGEDVPAGHTVQASQSGHITEPRYHLASACKVAGIEDLTLHGLRRSFKSLTEWLDCPAGVVAQIMGHKPSATAEKHYTVRPLDLLRIHHERIEAWILAEAGIKYQNIDRSNKLTSVT